MHRRPYWDLARSWKMPWGMSLVLVGLIAGPMSAAHAELVDRIVAAVDGHLLTASDLADYRSLFAPELRSDDEARKALIDRQLLIEEADRFAIEQPTPSAIDQRVQDTVQRLGGPDSFQRTLERMGWGSDTLRAWIADDLRIVDFLDQRIYFFVLIPPDEVTAYLDAHADEFAHLALDQARTVITERLTQQRGEEKRQQFLNKLRGKAAIRINPPVGPEGSTPAQPAH